MKKIYIIVSAVIFAFSLSAQEEYIFTQYFLNPATINPGASGFDGNHNILFNYRNTWAGFPNTPKSYQAHYNGEVANKVGIGATLVTDSYANLASTRGGLSFAYMIKGDSYKIGGGLSTQFQQYRVNNVDLSSSTIDQGDLFLLSRLDDAQFFEASLGFHGLLDNGLFFDLAFPGIVRSRINNTGSDEESLGSFNYFFGLGYEFPIANYDMRIVPSVYVKQFRNVPLHVDFNALLKFMDGRLISGITYSNGADNRLGFLIGAQVNKIGFNYSYNISFHDSQQYNNGGHEIGIALKLGSEPKKEMPTEN